MERHSFCWENYGILRSVELPGEYLLEMNKSKDVLKTFSDMVNYFQKKMA